MRLDSYPFGMVMPNRSCSAGTYRFGFNGKENDNEVKGNGNSVDFGERIDDSRIGRFLSVDPLAKKFASESNYIFAGNNPIFFVDVNGKYKYPPKSGYEGTYPTITKYLALYVQNDVINSQPILCGFEDHTRGLLTGPEVDKVTEWENGPTIVFMTDQPAGNFGYYSSATNTIYINSEIAKLVENASPEDKQAALLAFTTSLLHETTHCGDENIDKSMSDYEVGTKFVQQVYTNGPPPLSDGVPLFGDPYISTCSDGQYDNAGTINNANKVISEKSKTEEGQSVLPTLPKIEDKIPPPKKKK